MTDERDVMLVTACLRGDRESFDEIVERYEGPLYNAAYRITGSVEDAMDATQTAFVNAFEKLHTFDPKYRFFSWIYRIVVNLSLNMVDRRRDESELDGNFPAAIANPENRVPQNRGRRKSRGGDEGARPGPADRDRAQAHRGVFLQRDRRAARHPREDRQITALHGPPAPPFDPDISGSHPMKPERLESLVWESLDGTITAEERADLEQHIERHPEARELQREIEKLAEQLDGLGRAAPPENLRPRIAAALQEVPAPTRETQPVSSFVSLGGVAAAVGCLASVGGKPPGGSRRRLSLAARRGRFGRPVQGGRRHDLDVSRDRELESWRSISESARERWPSAAIAGGATIRIELVSATDLEIVLEVADGMLLPTGIDTLDSAGFEVTAVASQDRDPHPRPGGPRAEVHRHRNHGPGASDRSLERLRGGRRLVACEEGTGHQG